MFSDIYSAIGGLGKHSDSICLSNLAITPLLQELRIPPGLPASNSILMHRLQAHASAQVSAPSSPSTSATQASSEAGTSRAAVKVKQKK